MMDGLAGEWARLIRTTTYGDLPDEVVGRAKLAILDAVAVTGAGSTTRVAQAAEAYVRARQNGTAPAEGVAAYPKPARYCGWEAAGFVQGVYGYGNLYGDTSLRSVTHPGAVVLPAVLVTAATRRVTGKDAILATALAYQIMDAFAAPLNGQRPRMGLQIRGFRPTPTCGPLGVATAVGKLVGLDEETLASSLGIASNHGSGLRPNNGDPTASILVQTGTAVQLGLGAVGLAMAGVKGDPHAFEGKGGFLQAFGGRAEIPIEVQVDEWAISTTAVKLHATAHTLAPVLDLLLGARRTHDFALDDITGITIRVPRAHMLISGGTKPLPALASAATANYPFGAAAVLVSGDVLWPSAIDQLLHDADVARLAGVVEVREDSELSDRFDNGQALWPAAVDIALCSERISVSTDRPVGTRYDDETSTAVKRKLDVLAPQWPLYDVDTPAISDFILTLEQADDLGAGLRAVSGIAD